MFLKYCLIISNPLFLPGLQLLWKKRENWKIIPMWSEQCYGIHVSCTALYSVCLSRLCCLLAGLPALAWPCLHFGLWFIIVLFWKKTMRGMLDNCFLFHFSYFYLERPRAVSVSVWPCSLFLSQKWVYSLLFCIIYCLHSNTGLDNNVLGLYLNLSWVFLPLYCVLTHSIIYTYDCLSLSLSLSQRGSHSSCYDYTRTDNNQRLGLFECFYVTPLTS